MTPGTSFRFLVNPASGGGAAPEAVVPVARLLRDAGADVEVTYSPGPLAMRALVDAALDRGDVVVSVGGDGMLSSLAGLVAEGGGVLGVLPAGRGNDFARMLDLPTTPEAPGRAVPRRPDPPGRPDRLRTAPARNASSPVRSTPGSTPGPPRSSTARDCCPARSSTPTPPSARSRPTGPAATGCPSTATYARVLRGDRRGRELGVLRQGDADRPGRRRSADGLLDVVVIEAASRIALMRALPSVYDGSHVERDEVHVLTGTRVELRGRAGHAIPVGGDGEPLGVLPGLDDPPAVVGGASRRR